MRFKVSEFPGAGPVVTRLFGAQGGHRIDPRRAMGRQVSRRARDQDQEQRRLRVRDWIDRTDVEGAGVSGGAGGGGAGGGAAGVCAPGSAAPTISIVRR